MIHISVTLSFQMRLYKCSDLIHFLFWAFKACLSQKHIWLQSLISHKIEVRDSRGLMDLDLRRLLLKQIKNSVHSLS